MAGFSLPADVMRAFQSHYGSLQARLLEAQENIQQDVLAEAKSKAVQSDRWAEMVDQIEVWSEFDRFWVGVRSPQFISQAFAAEYGTDEYPPEPILRQMAEVTRNAAAKRFGAVANAGIAGGQDGA